MFLQNLAHKMYKLYIVHNSLKFRYAELKIQNYDDL